MHFERLSIEDGLSQGTVMSIVQDSSGFLWFATENGLNRYDGYEFHQYRRNHAADNALQIDFAGSLSLDAAGNVWVATDGGGVARWNAAGDDFTLYRHRGDAPETGLSDDHVRVVLADPRGWVWVGTRNSGLNRLYPDTGSVEQYRHAAGDTATLNHDDVYDIALDQHGRLWIATGDGLGRLDPASGRVERYDIGAGARIVETLLVDTGGIIWAGLHGGGLVRLDPGSGDYSVFRNDARDPSSLSNDRVQVLFEDSDQRFWVGTADGLNLMHRRTGTFTRYRHDPTNQNSIGDSNILSLYQDLSGLLWVGTRSGGIGKWNPRSWSFGHVAPRASASGGLSSGLISSFTEDRDGRLWVGTFGGGLNVLDRSMTTVRQFRHDPRGGAGLGDDNVMALLTDSAGRIWVGTMRAGLDRIDTDGNTVTRFRHDPDDPASLPADGIMSLLEDREGRIWVGTFGGGVARLDDDGRFVRYSPFADGPRRLPVRRATALAQARDGAVWVGTDGDGLIWLDPVSGAWRQFLNERDDVLSLSSNTVYALHVAGDELWVGTRVGLNRLVRTRSGVPAGFEVLTQRDGLSNDTIYGIRSDRDGRLWLSTNFGLIRYDAASGATRSFHRSNGLQGEEFNFGAHYADAAGRLYFGGSNGFNAFEPAELTFNPTPPPIALTAFSTFNAPVVTDVPYERLRRVDLGHADDVVTLEFSALDFVAPDENRYAYMLEGFDRDWVDAGTERRITYTNLDRGEYVLRVRAANSDGVWSSADVALPFSVAPAPWETWWARLIYAALIVAAVLLALRQQQRKLARESEYRERLEAEVRQRTHEIAESNSALLVANQKLHDASHTDALTGLRNRRYVFQELLQEIDQSGRFRIRDGFGAAGGDRAALLMVDLDHFKPINDTLGHQAGDKMLLQVRDALLEASRETDIVVRWGGDEFLVVARQTTRQEAVTLAERIRIRIAERVFALGNGRTERTTCSIGIAPFPFVRNRSDLLDWEQVLGIADIAMYRAKTGRDAWCCISGEQWSASGDALMRAIKDDVDELAGDGAVRIDSAEPAATGDFAAGGLTS